MGKRTNWNLGALLLCGTLAMACGTQKDQPPPAPQSKRLLVKVNLDASPNTAPIRREMWAMAYTIREVDEALSKHQSQAAVLKLLQKLDQSAGSLQDIGDQIHHPLLQQNMPQFRREIAYATAQIENEPPDFAYAATVVGSCVTCHDIRDCPFDAYQTCVDVPIY